MRNGSVQEGQLCRKVNCRASKSPFKPSRHTTFYPCCNSLHICSWWSQPWASALDALSIMVLTCPLSDRSTWDTASFSHMKVCSQSSLMSTSSMSLQAISDRVGKWAWCGCAHTTVRPNTLSHPMAIWGTINKNAMTCLGLSVLPHDSARERAVTCACVITYKWRVVYIGQKPCNPPVTLVVGSQRPASVERAAKALIVVCKQKKGIS